MRRRGQCCLDEGPEPPGSGRQGFRWPLAAHWEAAFEGPRGAQIPSAEGDKPHAGGHKSDNDQGSWPCSSNRS